MKQEHMRLKDAAKYLGLSLTTLWRLPEKDPTFPPKIQITSRCCVYRKSDLDEWLESKCLND